MVLQRGAPHRITGNAGSGPVLARINRGAWKKIGLVKNGQFTATLPALKPGGPYTIELTAGDEQLTVKDILVGDVWICAGQSNMQGVGWLRHADKPQPRVRAFYMSDQWGVARDPIHALADAVDEVHVLLNGGNRHGRNTHWGVGPAVAFGQEMHRRTGIPQGLLACAHGGTTMAQWDPGKKAEGTRSLYGATLRRVAKNGGRVAGIIWYQGESDANKDAAAVYTQKMRELVRAFRHDLAAPKLPFAMVQIARVVPDRLDATDWNFIQDQQRRLPDFIPHLTTVPAIDLPLDDTIHIGGTGNARLGRCLAEAMQALRGQKAKPPIAVRHAIVEADKFTTLANIIVEFDNVVGKLVSGSRPTGFSFDQTGPIFDTVLDKNRVIIRTAQSVLNAKRMLLHYGKGTDPYCNITDTAGRSLPVFGPLALGMPIAVTPFVKAQVTELLPGAGKLEGLTLPESLTWRTKEYVTEFCNLHDELGRAAPTDKLVFFRGDLNVPEPMKLVALLGYDGPVKLWLDGRELFHDPNGINPAIPDAKRIRFDAAPGKHEVVVALGSNSGKAWGIFLRFQRTDVSKLNLKRGPGAYTMPALI